MIKRILATTALIATGVVTFAACGKANKNPEGEGANNIKYNVGQHAQFTPTTNTLNDGELLEMPNEPTRQGYTFGGWYKDKNHRQRYDFNQPVNDDTTLHAKWYPVGTISDNYKQDIIYRNRPYTIKNYDNLNDNTSMDLTMGSHAGRVAQQYATNGYYRHGGARNRMSGTNLVGQNYGYNDMYLSGNQAVGNTTNNAYSGNTGINASIQPVPHTIMPAQTPIATTPEITSPAVANRLDNISDRIKSTGRYVKDMSTQGVFVDADQAIVSTAAKKDDEKGAKTQFRKRSFKSKKQISETPAPQPAPAPQLAPAPQTPAPQIAPQAPALQTPQLKTTA